MKRLRRVRVTVENLDLVGRAYPWPSRPGVGQRVVLNSGGPAMLIVDVDGDRMICAAPNGETTFDFRCLKPAA